MSGRKQHYIPQSLLRGFGDKKKKKYQVAVYTTQKPAFVTATDGVAAQRFFYSKPSDSADGNSLDDQITRFETYVDQAFRELRTGPLNTSIDATLAAKLVTHLVERNAHIRDSFQAAVDRLLTSLDGATSSTSTVKKVFKLEEIEHNKLFADEFDKFYNKNYFKFMSQGITKPIAKKMVSDYSKANSDELANNMMSGMNEMISKLTESIPETIKNAHNKSLEQKDSPHAREEALAGLNWTVSEPPISELILPDCVAVSYNDAGEAQPLIFEAAVEHKRVLMPLSRGRVLVGTKASVDWSVPASINNDAASSSLGFFIAGAVEQDFQKLSQSIGSVVQKKIEHSIPNDISTKLS